MTTALWIFSPQPPPAPRPPAGPLAPPFSLERLQGGRVSLAELRGKVVVIDFWATWCPPCRAELPWLLAMIKRYEARGITLVAIDEDDPPGQVPLVTEFASELPDLARFVALGDPDIEHAYGVLSLPTLIIVDREGRVIDRFVGTADEAELERLFERLATK